MSPFLLSPFSILSLVFPSQAIIPSLLAVWMLWTGYKILENQNWFTNTNTQFYYGNLSIKQIKFGQRIMPLLCQHWKVNVCSKISEFNVEKWMEKSKTSKHSSRPWRPNPDFRNGKIWVASGQIDSLIVREFMFHTIAGFPSTKLVAWLTLRQKAILFEPKFQLVPLVFFRAGVTMARAVLLQEIWEWNVYRTIYLSVVWSPAFKSF